MCLDRTHFFSRVLLHSRRQSGRSAQVVKGAGRWRSCDTSSTAPPVIDSRPRSPIRATPLHDGPRCEAGTLPEMHDGQSSQSWGPNSVWLVVAAFMAIVLSQRRRRSWPAQTGAAVVESTATKLLSPGASWHWLSVLSARPTGNITLAEDPLKRRWCPASACRLQLL